MDLALIISLPLKLTPAALFSFLAFFSAWKERLNRFLCFECARLFLLKNEFFWNPDCFELLDLSSYNTGVVALVASKLLSISRGDVSKLTSWHFNIFETAA